MASGLRIMQVGRESLLTLPKIPTKESGRIIERKAMDSSGIPMDLFMSGNGVTICSTEEASRPGLTGQFMMGSSNKAKSKGKVHTPSVINRNIMVVGRTI